MSMLPLTFCTSIYATVFFFLSQVSWFDGSGMGFSLEYPTIGLHAISRDTGTYPQEHLYVMVNGKLKGKSDKLMFNQNNMFLLENGLENLWLSSLMASKCESLMLLSYVSPQKTCLKKVTWPRFSITPPLHMSSACMFPCYTHFQWSYLSQLIIQKTLDLNKPALCLQPTPAVLKYRIICLARAQVEF